MSRIGLPPIRRAPFIGKPALRAINSGFSQLRDLSLVSGVGGIIAQRGPLGTTIRDASPGYRDVAFYGVLVSRGPDETSTDFTDARYWVRSVSMVQTQQASMADSVAAYMDACILESDGTYSGGMWLVASNLAELASGSHMLPVTTVTDNALTALDSSAVFVRVYQLEGKKVTNMEGDFGNNVYVFEVVGGVGYGNGTLITITGHTGAGAVSWNPYTGTLPGGASVSVWNGFEPVTGSPGPLGVNVAGDGSVNGGSCHVQPIGNGAVVTALWDAVNGRWAFSAPNSAQ